MSASKALDLIRRHGTARDVQTALYYVTRGRTAPLLELARSLTPPQQSDAPAIGPAPRADATSTPPAPVEVSL